MKDISLLLFIILITQSYVLHSQENRSNESNTIVKSVISEEGHEYELIIKLPDYYKKEKNYKVLYYLDGWWLSELVNGSYRINALTKDMEELILVGISLKGDEEEWNKQRNRDYTPSIYNREKMKISMKGGAIDLNEKTTGGGEKFFKFLKEVVFHEIESNYRIDKSQRGILGHSFGGLFAFYCLIQDVDLFENYILISPAIWWNKTELLIDENLQKINPDANLYIVMGDKESNLLKNPINELTNKLIDRKDLINKIEFKIYAEKDHHSILPIGIYEGLELLYARK